jgi:hypothetical protein
MGLDTYGAYHSSHPKYVKDNSLIPNELFPKNCLCGGMFSGGGNSFRGKVYAPWVEWATGYSLYEEELTEEDVDVIVEKLSNCTNEDCYAGFVADTGNEYDVDYNELKGLLKWFEVVKSERGIVVGWW